MSLQWNLLSRRTVSTNLQEIKHQNGCRRGGSTNSLLWTSKMRKISVNYTYKSRRKRPSHAKSGSVCNWKCIQVGSNLVPFLVSRNAMVDSWTRRFTRCSLFCKEHTGFPGVLKITLSTHNCRFLHGGVHENWTGNLIPYSCLPEQKSFCSVEWCALSMQVFWSSSWEFHTWEQEIPGFFAEVPLKSLNAQHLIFSVLKHCWSCNVAGGGCRSVSFSVLFIHPLLSRARKCNNHNT